MRPEESKQYEIPGATGPGTTINLHKRSCSLPASSRPAPYPHDRRH
ncbi:hypothetical protein ACIA74_25375 [Streptomyces sp. NPDC051658]